MRTMEDHIVEICEKAVVNQAVEIAVDRGIAEPAFVAADDRKMRPAFVLGVMKPARGGIGVEFEDVFRILKSHQQIGAGIQKRLHVIVTQRFEIAKIIRNGFQSGEPFVRLQPRHFGLKTQAHIFHHCSPIRVFPLLSGSR